MSPIQFIFQLNDEDAILLSEMISV